MMVMNINFTCRQTLLKRQHQILVIFKDPIFGFTYPINKSVDYMILIRKVFSFKKLYTVKFFSNNIYIFIYSVDKTTSKKKIWGHNNFLISKLGYDIQTLPNRRKSHSRIYSFRPSKTHVFSNYSSQFSRFSIGRDI